MSRVIPPHATPPSITDLETIAAAAFAEIPEELRRYAVDVAIRVEDFPDEETEREMELESPFDILGIYQGIAIPSKSVAEAQAAVDIILLFRRPILDYWCETGEDLTSLVRHVMIHEIGHHFGFSDDDMERLEEDE